MSFFGNNARPDLLKSDESPRPEGRFGEGGTQTAVPEPAPTFSTEGRTSFSAAVAQTPGATPPDRCTNIVGSGATWKGALTVEESVRIDGTFSGEIECKGTVHVSEGAEVDAKVHAAFVVISGSFRGEIRADQKTELLPSSRVAGEINTKLFSVHEGASLDGNVQMTGESAGRENTRPSRNGAAEADSAERRNNRTEAPAATPAN